MNPRRIAEWAVPLAAVAAVPLTSLAMGDRLPDPIAIHWGADGQPDGAGTLALSTALMTAVAALLGLGPIAALRRIPGRTTARALVATAHGAAAFLLAVHVVGLLANLDVTTWREASRLGPGSMLSLLVLSLPFAAIGWVLPSDRPDAGPAVHPARSVDLEPGDPVVWSGRARAHGAWIPLAVVAGVAGLLVAVGDATPPAVLLAVLAAVAVAALLTLSGAHATVGPAEARIGIGPLPWPRIRIPLEEVAGVDVIDVEPMAYGGWGYRIVPGTRAVIMRAGEGMRIQRRGSVPDVVVTVDDARTGAGVLLAHLAERGT